jgi:two-component system sensor histidine kinase BarA
MHVLIADDDPVGQEISRHLLEHHGHRVVCVQDGAAALSAMAAQVFDVVLLDLRMPGTDGWAVAQALTNGAPVCGAPRLVALSAGVNPADAVALCTAGFAACLRKPLRLADLLATLAEPTG